MVVSITKPLYCFMVELSHMILAVGITMPRWSWLSDYRSKDVNLAIRDLNRFLLRKLQFILSTAIFLGIKIASFFQISCKNRYLCNARRKIRGLTVVNLVVERMNSSFACLSQTMHQAIKRASFPPPLYCCD